MFPTRSNRAAPERCLLFLIPLGGFLEALSFQDICSSSRKGFGPEPVSKAEHRVQEGPGKPSFHPRKPGLDVEEGPFRAASKSYEAGLQPRRESFQNVVATVNRNVFSGSFKTYVGPYNASACPKVKSPAAPAGNISRVMGVGAIVEVFSRNGL
jgi:hypothetical protein